MNAIEAAFEVHRERRKSTTSEIGLCNASMFLTLGFDP